MSLPGQRELEIIQKRYPMVDERENRIIMGTVWLFGGVNNSKLDQFDPPGNVRTIMPFYFNRLANDWISVEAVSLVFGREEDAWKDDATDRLHPYCVQRNLASNHYLGAVPGAGYLMFSFGRSNIGVLNHPTDMSLLITKVSASDAATNTVTIPWPDSTFPSQGAWSHAFDPPFQVDKFDTLQLSPVSGGSPVGMDDPYVILQFHFKLQDRDAVEADV